MAKVFKNVQRQFLEHVSFQNSTNKIKINQTLEIDQEDIQILDKSNKHLN